MVRVVDDLRRKKCIDSSCKTATDAEILEGVQNSRSHAQQMAQDRVVLIAENRRNSGMNEYNRWFEEFIKNAGYKPKSNRRERMIKRAWRLMRKCYLS